MRATTFAVVVGLALALSPACSGTGGGGTGGGSATGGGSTAAGGGSASTGGGSTATGGGAGAVGGGSAATGGGVGSLGGGAAATGGGSTSSGGGSAATGGGSSSAGGGTQTDAGSDMSYTMPPGDCFTFATAMLGSNNGQSCGDWLGLQGENVDLAGIGSNLCLLDGTYTSLSQVPSSYTACQFTSYIEGGNGLAGSGIIVIDAATSTHHYKVYVVTNTPSLVFSFAKID